jgi:dTDP-4-amino-4,6-dideoxygalactose transaminase
MAAVMAESAFVGASGNRFVREFEAKFAEFSGSENCIACANGTDALEILLKAAGLGPGDEVIVPAVSWIATSEAVSNMGGVPIFADVRTDDGTIDPEAVAALVGPRTWGIIPVHLYGQPADMGPLMEIAERHGLFVLEDCAQAHGALWEGRPVGTIGNAGSFSFFPGKNLGAYGDAGGMITSDAGLARRARMIGQHGQTGRKFHHEIEGRNSRMDGLQAAVLGVKLPHLEEWTKQRIAVAGRYRERLAGVLTKLPVARDGTRHVFHLFAIRTGERDAARAHMEAAGIPTGVQYPVPLPLLDAYRARGFSAGDFACAEGLSREVLTLPIYPELDDGRLTAVIDALVCGLGREGER